MIDQLKRARDGETNDGPTCKHGYLPYEKCPGCEGVLDRIAAEPIKVRDIPEPIMATVTHVEEKDGGLVFHRVAPQPVAEPVEGFHPCPFCGGEAEEAMRTGAVFCTECDVSRRSKREWNRRASPPPSAAPTDNTALVELEVVATAENIARHLSAINNAEGFTGRYHAVTLNVAKEAAEMGIRAALSSREAAPKAEGEV